MLIINVGIKETTHIHIYTFLSYNRLICQMNINCEDAKVDIAFCKMELILYACEMKNKLMLMKEKIIHDKDQVLFLTSLLIIE